MDDFDLYTVFGNPIEHSLSPEIHQYFAKSLNEKIIYNKTLVPIHEFSIYLQEFANKKGKGANVTVPFKEHAYSCCSSLSENAKKAKAVNTLVRIENQHWHGENTDGIGLVADILRLGHSICDARILILGAGGAVRGILQPLINENPRSIIIANRSFDKAKLLAHEFNIQAQVFHQLTPSFDIIINGTSASLTGEIPNIPTHIFQAALCYDMVYNTQKDTAFLAHAKLHGCLKVADGLGMLLSQAAAAYQLWRGRLPDINPLFAQLKNP